MAVPWNESLYGDHVDNEQQTTEDSPAEQVARLQSSYTPKYQRFVVKEKKYNRQFSHIYLKRLLRTRKWLEKAALDFSGEEGAKVTEKLIDLRDGDRCVVIGTIYKDMKLKPSVLDEFAGEPGQADKSWEAESYVSDDDSLILEDESGRVLLKNMDADVHKIVTGVVLAVEGLVLATGELEVSRWSYAAPAPQAPLPQVSASKYVLMLSGLNVAGSNDPLPLQMMVDYVLGHLGNRKEQEFESGIVRVIVAGNCVELVKEDENHVGFRKKKTAAEQERAAMPIKQLDMIFSQLAGGVPVDVMPGANDPSGFALPQQPLHRCLFPLSAKCDAFRCVTNPYDCIVDGVRLCGTSGQAISDMSRYTKGRSRLDLLEDTLKARHLCPTAPDTISCYPFYDDDPFCMDESPHIMFAGNQDKFSERMHKAPGQTVRLLTLPAFSSTGVAVLVDLKSLECLPLHFDASMLP